MSKSKARVSGCKPDESRVPREPSDHPDLLAQLPPKKPPATSVRQRQKLSRRRSG